MDAASVVILPRMAPAAFAGLQWLLPPLLLEAGLIVLVLHKLGYN